MTLYFTGPVHLWCDKCHQRIRVNARSGLYTVADVEAAEHEHDKHHVLSDAEAMRQLDNHHTPRRN